MTKHMTPGLRAAFAAGQHLQRKDAGDTLELLTKRFGEFATAVEAKVTATEKKSGEVATRIQELERRAASDRPNDVTRVETWGNQFVTEKKSDLENLMRSKGSVSLNVKAITNATDSVGVMESPTRDHAVLLPRQRMTIRNLLSVVEISTGTVEYVRQVARPTSAGMVPEGALKPESDFSFDLASTTAQVIAHHVKASRQALEDHAQLRDLIDTEMRYGLALKEEEQLLFGSGIAPNLSGLVPAATEFVDPLGLAAGATRIDLIGAALLQSALADFPATGIVMHPADWVRISLLKDADGRYIVGSAVDMVQPRLFGLPVVATKAMEAGEFLVGDFARAATIYDRWQPRVEVGFVDQDFARNMVTILAEQRIALAVKQPLAMTYGSFE